MIIDSCYTFFPIDFAPLNSPVTEPVMNTNLIEPHVLNRKRDSKLQHVLGAGARRVRWRPHLHLLHQQPFRNNQGTVNMGAYLIAKVPVPTLTPKYLILENPLTRVLLLASMC